MYCRWKNEKVRYQFFFFGNRAKYCAGMGEMLKVAFQLRARETL